MVKRILFFIAIVSVLLIAGIIHDRFTNRFEQEEAIELFKDKLYTFDFPLLKFVELNKLLANDSLSYYVARMRNHGVYIEGDTTIINDSSRIYFYEVFSEADISNARLGPNGLTIFEFGHRDLDLNWLTLIYSEDSIDETPTEYRWIVHLENNWYLSNYGNNSSLIKTITKEKGSPFGKPF